jgi:uncharacterized iron-regulated membrane protein
MKANRVHCRTPEILMRIRRRRWLTYPQSLPIRRVFLRIHVLLGLVLAPYIFLITLSGCVLMFYPQLYQALTPHPTILPSSIRLDRTALKIAAEQTHPGYEVSWIWDRKQPTQAVEVWMSNGVGQQERLFDPFTGRDLGDALPKSIRLLNWLKDLRTSLAFGTKGRLANALGAALVTVLSITGALIWWRRTRSWTWQVKAVQTGGRPRHRPRDLHRSIGLWTLPLLLMWGMTGIVLVTHTTPAPVFYSLHFGRFTSAPLKAIWAIFALAPSLLIATGLLLWWKRSTRYWPSTIAIHLRAKQVTSPGRHLPTDPQPASSFHPPS